MRTWDRWKQHTVMFFLFYTVDATLKAGTSAVRWIVLSLFCPPTTIGKRFGSVHGSHGAIFHIYCAIHFLFFEKRNFLPTPASNATHLEPTQHGPETHPHGRKRRHRRSTAIAKGLPFKVPRRGPRDLQGKAREQHLDGSNLAQKE